MKLVGGLRKEKQTCKIIKGSFQINCCYRISPNTLVFLSFQGAALFFVAYQVISEVLWRYLKRFLLKSNKVNENIPIKRTFRSASAIA
ncbi:hypothetical protein [Bacillus sp. P14.5]|uniref:hypothetical protein n=1 Tax=Bacillus sp. P14.5 TaxID=1983400 RepID=UPI0013B06392|nr:hypothetical protein [Bacillus sp. P14.5]